MSKELLQTLRDHLISTQEPDDIYHRCYDRIEELERQLLAEKERCDSYMEDNKRLADERDALQADNARLREALNKFVLWANDETMPTREAIQPAVEALAATPEQSLARIRNQILEEAAEECEESCQMDDEGWGYLYAKRVRDLKIVEPE